MSSFATSQLHDQYPYRRCHHCSLSLLKVLISKINSLRTSFYLVFIFHCLFFNCLRWVVFEKFCFLPLSTLLITISFIMQSDTKIHYFNKYRIKIVNSFLLCSILMVISCFKSNWLSTCSLIYELLYTARENPTTAQLAHGFKID